LAVKNAYFGPAAAAAKFQSSQLMTSFVRLGKVVVDNGAANSYLHEDTPTELSPGAQ
jgi:hypothetical protein